MPEGDDPAVVEGDHNIWKGGTCATGQVLVEMHVTIWAAAHRDDPVLDVELHWLEAKKKLIWGHSWGSVLPVKRGNGMEESSEFHGPPGCPLSAFHAQRGERGSSTLCCAKGTSDCCFKLVSSRHRHHSHDHTLSLLQECFWWPGMAKQMRQTIRALHTHCLQYECGFPNVPLCPLWLLLPWISYMLTLQALRPSWSQTNHLESPMSWCSKTTSKACVSIYDPWSDCENHCQIFIWRLHLSLGPWSGSWVIEVLASWVV